MCNSDCTVLFMYSVLYSAYSLQTRQKWVSVITLETLHVYAVTQGCQGTLHEGTEGKGCLREEDQPV